MILLNFLTAQSADLFVEAESFTHKGGWVVDQQFMDLMGSSYLLAHGMGEPVGDARTEVVFRRKENTMYMFVHIIGLLPGKTVKVRVSSICMSIIKNGIAAWSRRECLDVATRRKCIGKRTED